MAISNSDLFADQVTQFYGGGIVPPKSTWPHQQISVKEARKQLKEAEKREAKERKIRKSRKKLEAKRTRARDVALTSLHRVAEHGIDEGARIEAASKLLSYGTGHYGH